jgi:hypothetical protein
VSLELEFQKRMYSSLPLALHKAKSFQVELEQSAARPVVTFFNKIKIQNKTM